MRKIWLGILAILVLASQGAWADVVRITPAELEEHGIIPAEFVVFSFSPDGRSLMGLQEAATEEIGEGITDKLFLLRLRSDGQVTEVKRYDLRVRRLEDANFTPSGREVMLIGGAGSRYFVLNLDSGEVRTLMEHRPGQPGFRAQPPVMWIAGDKLLGLGYFYDAEDYAGADVIAAIDPAGSGVSAFTSCSEIEPVERGFKKNIVFHVYTEQGTGFFNVREGGFQKFHHWTAGSPSAAFDQASRFTGFFGAGQKVAYGAERGAGQFELMLYDGAAREKKVLGTSTLPFENVTMSQDGSTVVALHADERMRMKVVAASARTGWTARPVEGLANVRVGAIRLSADGKRMSIYNRDGLYLVDLP